MRKRTVVAFTGLAFLVGFALGGLSWEKLRVFAPVVITPQVLPEVYHFGVARIPPFSSDHYYFREGFPDVDEYWSFCLPPERAEAFLQEYVEQTKVPPVKSGDTLPEWILGHATSDQWDSRYWFHGFEELDRIYYEEYRFCGYSAGRNRSYLVNWNE